MPKLYLVLIHASMSPQENHPSTLKLFSSLADAKVAAARHVKEYQRTVSIYTCKHVLTLE